MTEQQAVITLVFGAMTLLFVINVVLIFMESRRRKQIAEYEARKNAYFDKFNTHVGMWFRVEIET